MVVLILVLAMCAKPKGSDSDVVVNANATESTQATEEAYQVDANENINALITQYYTAYAAEMLRHFPRLQHRFLQMSELHRIIFTVCG